MVAGGCPSSQAIELAEKSFGRLEGECQPIWPISASPEVPRLQSAGEVLRDRSGYSYLLLCYRFPRAGHPDYEACELLSRVLGEGDSCRLYEVFVRERKRVQEVWMSLEPQAREHPLVHFGMATAEEIEPGLAEELKQYLEALPELLRQEELDKARRTWFCEDAFRGSRLPGGPLKESTSSENSPRFRSRHTVILWLTLLTNSSSSIYACRTR